MSKRSAPRHLDPNCEMGRFMAGKFAEVCPGERYNFMEIMGDGSASMYKLRCKVCGKEVKTSSLYCSVACQMDAIIETSGKPEILPISEPNLRRVIARRKTS